MMTNDTGATYREATTLEAKLYWEALDKLDSLRTYAMSVNDAELVRQFYVEKEKTFAMLRNAGYRASPQGLYMREDDDILNGPYNEHLDAATHIDFVQAMRAMRGK